MGSIEKRIVSAVLSLVRTRRETPSAARDASSARPGNAPQAVLREVRFSDFHGVAELKERWGLSHDSGENWERLWRDNPAFEYSQDPRPMGWVLEAEGKIVGYIGNVSRLYRYGDKTLTAAISHGLVTEPQYRSLSYSLVGAFFRQKSLDLYFSTTAIEAVGKIALSFKSSALPQADYDTVLFWIVRPYGFAQGLMRKLSVGRRLAPIGSFLGGLAIGSDRILRRRWPRRSSALLQVAEIKLDSIGNEFQDFWAQKLNEKRRIFADRTPAALRWHFGIPGDRGSVCVLCCRKDGKLAGYVVIRTDADPQTGLQKSIIADLLARHDDPAVVQALWAAAYEHAKARGSHILEVQGFPPEIRAACTDWRPYRRKYPACPYYYKAANLEFHKELGNPAAWYACPFDGDTTLIRPSYSSTPLQVTFEDKEEVPGEPAIDLPEGERTRVF